MIGKLKEACGSDFTGNITRMYKDVGRTSEINLKFSQFLSDQGLSLPFAFHIQVGGHGGGIVGVVL